MSEKVRQVEEQNLREQEFVLRKTQIDLEQERYQKLLEELGSKSPKAAEVLKNMSMILHRK